MTFKMQRWTSAKVQGHAGVEGWEVTVDAPHGTTMRTVIDNKDGTYTVSNPFADARTSKTFNTMEAAFTAAANLEV